MGLDPDEHSRHFAGILFPTWKLARDDNAVYDFTRKAALEMEEKLRKLDLFNPYVYINDAAKGQRPFEMYAEGAHLTRLREIQANMILMGSFGTFSSMDSTWDLRTQLKHIMESCESVADLLL
ncbi:hypothetical protein F4680DRAFT_468329 [Xylaria scruposa]|nr:hypothetical protein F4680DRAFT_468329 [Xylaria scruposa]